MKFLIVKEVATIMRVSSEHVRRLIRGGSLPAFKVGRRGGYRIKEEDLDHYIETQSRLNSGGPNGGGDSQ